MDGFVAKPLRPARAVRRHRAGPRPAACHAADVRAASAANRRPAASAHSVYTGRTRPRRQCPCPNPAPRPAGAVPHPRPHRRRHPVAGDRHRRQRRHLLALQPDAAAAAAGARIPPRLVNLGAPGPEARLAVVEQRRLAANTPSATRCSATSRRRRPASAASPRTGSSRRTWLQGPDDVRHWACSSRAATSACSA